MNLPSGKNYGLIAQELEEVMPELVSTSIQPKVLDDEGKVIKKAIDYKAVNYTGLIPLLLAGMQEQQETIDEKDKQIEELNTVVYELLDRVAALEEGKVSSNGNVTPSGSTASDIKVSLDQNRPNPFSGTTNITYTIEGNWTSAAIIVVNADGKPILKETVSEKYGHVKLGLSDLKPGTYIYSLVVDGKTMASKRMVKL